MWMVPEQRFNFGLITGLFIIKSGKSKNDKKRKKKKIMINRNSERSKIRMQSRS